jgi:hypothetical protein
MVGVHYENENNMQTLTTNLAVLRGHNENQKYNLPRDPSRNRPKTKFLRELTTRTLPREPPEGGGAKRQINHRFKHSQAREGDAILLQKIEMATQCPHTWSAKHNPLVTFPATLK